MKQKSMNYSDNVENKNNSVWLMIIKYYKILLVLSVVFIGVIAVVGMGIFGFKFYFDWNNEWVKSQYEIKDLSSKYYELNEKIQRNYDKIDENINQLNNSFRELDEKVGKLSNNSIKIDENSKIIAILPNYIEQMKFSSVINNNEKAVLTVNDPETPIAIDLKFGCKYTALELQNEKIVMYYRSNADHDDIVFYGMLDEKFHWDGECVVNAYVDNCLSFVCEANYDSGTCLNKKYIYATEKKRGDNKIKIWSMGDRVLKENNGIDEVDGTILNYYRSLDYEFDIDFEHIDINNVVTLDKMRGTIAFDPIIEGFYYGKTSDGLYNDSTGGAFLVKYNEEGEIRTFYNGRFKNGEFDDLTGEAWEIVYDTTQNQYMYYRGKFANGERYEKDDTPKYVTMDYIYDIVKKFNGMYPENWIINKPSI